MNHRPFREKKKTYIIQLTTHNGPTNTSKLSVAVSVIAVLTIGRNTFDRICRRLIENICFRLLDKIDGTNGSVVRINMDSTRLATKHALESSTSFHRQRFAVQPGNERIHTAV